MKFYICCLTVLFLTIGAGLAAQEQFSENEANTERLFLDAYQKKISGKTDEAIAIYQEVLKIDNKNYAAAFELARIYLGKSDNEEAVRWIRKAIELAPGNTFFHEFLAELYHNNGRYAEAAAVYEDLIRLQPREVSYHYQQAFQWVKANDIPKALKVYDELEKKTGVNEELARRKQALYLGSGDTKKAAKEIEKLVTAFPKTLEYRHMLAAFHLQTGNEDAAEKVFHEILAIDPDDPRALMALAGQQTQNTDESRYLSALKPAFEDQNVSIDLKIGKILPLIQKVADNGDPSLAAGVLDLTGVLEKVHPSDAKAFAASGDLLYHSRRLPEALEKYTRAIQLNDGVYAVWEQILLIHAREHQYKEIVRTSESAIEIFPNRAALYYFYGMAQLELGDPEDAVSLLDQALLMSSGDPLLRQSILARMGQAQNELGRLQEADKSFADALAIKGAGPELAACHSLALSERQGQNALARQEAEKALQLAPESPLSLNAMGWSLYHDKKWQEARQYFEKALEKSREREPRLLEYYGDLLFQLGEQNKAIEFWQKAKAAGRHSRFLDRKINEKKLIE